MTEDRPGLLTQPGKIARDLRTYFGETVWRPLAKGTPLSQRIARRTSRYLYLIVRGFVDDRVLVRAPALTLITLLACVPLLALVFYGLFTPLGLLFKITRRDRLRRRFRADRSTHWIPKEQPTDMRRYLRQF